MPAQYDGARVLTFQYPRVKAQPEHEVPELKDDAKVDPESKLQPIGGAGGDGGAATAVIVASVARLRDGGHMPWEGHQSFVWLVGRVQPRGAGHG